MFHFFSLTRCKQKYNWDKVAHFFVEMSQVQLGNRFSLISDWPYRCISFQKTNQTNLSLDVLQEEKMKTDLQIQSDVIQALKWDPSVTQEHIGVSVVDGIATLSGSVPSYIEKWAAEKAAQRVTDVKAVVEKIEVKPAGSLARGDQELAKTILEQFKWAVQVPDKLIKAKVENGWVELVGEVDWEFQRRAAENCVRGLMGVKGISNNISIKVKKVQSGVIKKNIEEALKREVEREARRISVDVHGTKVTLTGDVHSFTAMNNARWAALNTVGVTSVDNKLHISP